MGLRINLDFSKNRHNIPRSVRSIADENQYVNIVLEDNNYQLKVLSKDTTSEFLKILQNQKT